jgi:hypothetical protein
MFSRDGIVQEVDWLFRGQVTAFLLKRLCFSFRAEEADPAEQPGEAWIPAQSVHHGLDLQQGQSIRALFTGFLQPLKRAFLVVGAA